MTRKHWVWTLALAIGAASVAHAGDAPAKPPMTRAQALAILKQQQLDPSPDGLAQQILSGDADSVEALVVAGVDVRAKASLPQSPLELASMTCAGGRTEPEDTVRIINVLLTAGADPNTPGMAGLGPLTLAAQQCKPPVIKRLIAGGAKLDARTPQGFTPLSMALITSNFDAAATMIDAGATLSAEAGRKFTDGPSVDPRLRDLVARATKGP